MPLPGAIEICGFATTRVNAGGTVTTHNVSEARFGRRVSIVFLKLQVHAERSLGSNIGRGEEVSEQNRTGHHLRSSESCSR